MFAVHKLLSLACIRHAVCCTLPALSCGCRQCCCFYLKICRKMQPDQLIPVMWFLFKSTACTCAYMHVFWATHIRAYIVLAFAWINDKSIKNERMTILDGTCIFYAGCRLYDKVSSVFIFLCIFLSLLFLNNKNSRWYIAF